MYELFDVVLIYLRKIHKIIVYIILLRLNIVDFPVFICKYTSLEN